MELAINEMTSRCRAGLQCPFKHLQPKDRVTNPRPKPDPRQAEGAQGPSVVQERQALSHQTRALVSGSSPSQKPLSQLQQSNPREFQLGQVIRRFSPVRRDTPGDTTLSFALAPSDPDFPFELEGGLHCILTVPTPYLQNGRPTIKVTNAEMARGFQINVEKGFDSLVQSSPNKTLLALLNELDKHLEKFLTSEKAQTIKIIANADKNSRTPEPVPQVARLPSPPPISVAPRPLWTNVDRSNALAKREADVRQLEARMGRIPHYSKSPDGTTFNIPIQVAKSDRLPLNLQPLREVTLIVPRLYNLEPCTVLLKGVSGSEAETVQLAFERHVRKHLDMTLMAHINYLTQNIHSMASEMAQTTARTAPPDIPAPQQPPVEETQQGVSTEEGVEEPRGLISDEGRPHVMFIPRPPEWDRQDDSESSYDSGEFSGSEDEEQTDDEDEADSGGAALPVSSTATEKGIHISFPNLELHNIELLTLASLSLSVKCLRCKSPLDISNIKPSGDETSPSASSVRTASCPKCTTPFTVSYTPNALHANTVRAGTIEITGCTITDLLPSVFQPTCASCSTTFPVPPGMVSVRGDTPIQVCRSCHAKMTFTIHEVKFLRVSHASSDTLPLRRPKKENLGISAGTPLPDNGTCAHYRHSYRWFRFSCCHRVYPCDRCHDAAEAHVNEHADRMVCGWCSREQRFRSEDCGVCGRSVIRRRRAAGGFWEGGKGTRDKGLMSRKEKRKYKRPRGSAVGSAAVAAKKDAAK
ncbi:uncharacterized protein A1O5_11707 [Cladophialophora psammophila CBS 110553]|uniref:CHY-type domain-containing protein n=1 Tax=Cladophialophora psammophila CBS 110553 TaxID=1182543 RepID=W9W0D9_9EURO|nr:uncharacterized protein A1O5_11707 [Cladophialophora psammophila CBS 110553]EXJ61393.1 hypothetical protein A1O5_11707 [Cladophialophora psammophila CBS 110553]